MNEFEKLARTIRWLIEGAIWSVIIMGILIAGNHIIGWLL